MHLNDTTRRIRSDNYWATRTVNVDYCMETVNGTFNNLY
jgi:hypothetical protein